MSNQTTLLQNLSFMLSFMTKLYLPWTTKQDDYIDIMDKLF